MIHAELDVETGIAVFTPEGTLSKDDFDSASGVVDAYLQTHEKKMG